MGERTEVVIDGKSLNPAQVSAVADGRAMVRLSASAAARMKGAHEVLLSLLSGEKPIYGVNTGFGKLHAVKIPGEELTTLQVNLLRSHAGGTGELLPARAVRAALLVRANTLAAGYSAVRPALVELLAEMLNRRVHPLVPSRGSLGASGDLAQLAHISLVLMGEGEAEVDGQVLGGAEALRAVGLKPLMLQPKEGLGLINGTAVTTGLAALSVHEGMFLLGAADAAAALTFEALGGMIEALDERLHRLRPHPGQQRAARNLRSLLAGSRLVARESRQKVQDPYTLRCVPQVHGACWDAWETAAAVVGRELNAVTDNPLVFPEEGEVISGGNFHAQPVAMACDLLGIALATLGTMSERRIERLLNPQLSGLPAFLACRPGVESGLMIAQYTAAALVAENRLLASPASVDSIPVSAAQEDHVSMGALAALKLRRMGEHLAAVIGIELICACQAIDLQQAADHLGKGTAAVYREVRKRVKSLTADRVLAPDIRATAQAVLSGSLVPVAGNHQDPEMSRRG